MNGNTLYPAHTKTPEPQVSFIDDAKIKQTLFTSQSKTPEEIRQIIAKALHFHGLSPEETAALLQTSDPHLKQEIYDAAGRVKEAIYGKRVVLFAPLYLSNYCANQCSYCSYRAGNKIHRRKLSLTEIAAEVKNLEKMGHKRLALETGEDPTHCPLEYVLAAIKTIYETSEEQGNIRRVNVNIAATTVENYEKLRDAGIGTYILFQETYHQETYEKVHPAGPKSSYYYHTTAFDRAMTAGIDDVGAGVLFGLYDYKYEVLALLYHALHLEKTFGAGPHTISVPRIKTAVGVDPRQFPYTVTDQQFKDVIAVLRLAVPYTGIILSTRESAALRDEAIALGVSQVSAGSCTGVGGYTDDSAKKQMENTSQFQVSDERTPDQVLTALCTKGYLPSYCTACYRKGRTGDRFMSLAKTGGIANVCLPNALMTFQEYLEDYASPEMKQLGEQTIASFIGDIKNDATRAHTIANLAKIKQGERDLYL